MTINLNLPTIFNIIDLFVPLVLIIFYIIYIMRLHKVHQKEIIHIRFLMDTLAAGMCSPSHKAMYHKLSEMTPEKALEAMKDKSEFCRLMTTESFIEARKVLEKIMSEIPPEKKEEFQEAIDELDGMFNLLSTIDNNTSKEHVDKIMNEIGVSLNKLNEKGINIGLQGFGPF